MIARVLRDATGLVRLRLNPVALHRSRGVRIGQGCDLIGTTLTTFGSEPYLVSLGDGVTVSHAVDFITHDGALRVIRDSHPDAYFYAPITVGDGVFIGAHAVLLPGVTVGAGAVIGAGSLVTRDIAPGTVVGGVPAQQIKTVEEYGLARRADWIDTSGLSPVQKERLLRERFAS